MLLYQAFNYKETDQRLRILRKKYLQGTSAAKDFDVIAREHVGD